jgi:heme oxygenase
MAPAPRPARTLAGADGWGAQYVLEGSRLGGRMLAGRVGAGLPRRYLAERTGPGGWLRFQDELRAEALAGGAGWLERAIAAARAAFIRFADAAEAHWDAAA